MDACMEVDGGVGERRGNTYIYQKGYQCWTLPVLGQWPKKLIWVTKFFISVAQTHL